VTVSAASTCAARAAADPIVPDRTVANNAAPGTINISKTDDRSLALNGAVFTLYRNTAPLATWESATETTPEGSPQTTAGSGTAQFANVPLGEYCVVETTTPAGHSTAAPQCVTVGLGDTAGTGQTTHLDFTNPRTHRVIVIVCHEGTNTLLPSEVTLGTGTGSVKTSLAAGGLPTNVTEAMVCGLGGASYGDKAHGTYVPSVVIASH
jgi:hypothetical protein